MREQEETLCVSSMVKSVRCFKNAPHIEVPIGKILDESKLSIWEPVAKEEEGRGTKRGAEDSGQMDEPKLKDPSTMSN